ncbi:PLC-like phosphodiesterase [Xylariaceae sp. FL0662B]|nr:PLC-like phosphodiesterase [Xylariaceae sp. FL0662B]
MIPEHSCVNHHNAVEIPLAEKQQHHPSIAMSDEQTPLLDAGKAALGDGVPAVASIPKTTSLPRLGGGGGGKAPQAIAHRGYKAAAPENTMLAFRAAVECGAAAIETDLHLSRDGVLVLSHDATLKRCFGVNARLRDRDWAYLSTLRTLRQPAQPMPRLLDLLAYLNQPGLEHVWLMLDLKTHDDADGLVRRLAETLASVPEGKRPWKQRITPCCWTAQYVRLSKRYLPGYRPTSISYSTTYARALAAQAPDVPISMVRHALATPVVGRRFRRDMRRAGRPLHAWTVNDEAWMAWCVRERLDGVVTDDPKLFLEVCRRLRDDEPKDTPSGWLWWCQSQREVSVVRGVRYVFEMAVFHLLLLVVMLVHLVRRGRPHTHIRKMLEG